MCYWSGAMPLLALLTFSLAALFAGLSVGALLNRSAFERRLDAEVAELFSEVETLPTYYSEREVAELPEAVRRFFQRNLQDGQPHPSCVRVRESGSARDKPGQPWTEFLGETYLVAGSAALLSFRRLRPLPLLWIDHRELYLRRRAHRLVKLLSSLSAIDKGDDATRKAVLVGYLADLALLPAALLPSDDLKWTAAGEDAATVHLRDGELEVSGTFHFDELGNAVSFESADRPRLDGQLGTWRVRYGEYRGFGELQLPTQIDAEWQLGEQVFVDAKRIVEAVELDVPRRWGAAKIDPAAGGGETNSAAN